MYFNYDEMCAVNPVIGAKVEELYEKIKARNSQVAAIKKKIEKSLSDDERKALSRRLEKISSSVKEQQQVEDLMMFIF